MNRLILLAFLFYAFIGFAQIEKSEPIQETPIEIMAIIDVIKPNNMTSKKILRQLIKYQSCRVNRSKPISVYKQFKSNYY